MQQDVTLEPMTSDCQSCLLSLGLLGLRYLTLCRSGSVMSQPTGFQMFFLPGAHKEHGLSYSPLKALVSPRAVGWISSHCPDNIANLSPSSFFNAIAELPPMVMFISAPDTREENKGGRKDSIANILETGEFGVNIVGTAQAEQMVTSSRNVTSDTDEFDLAGLTKKTAEKISVPLVAGAPAHKGVCPVPILLQPSRV